jgi:hypothetical protein
LFDLAIASKSISWSRLTVLLVIFAMWGGSTLIASQIDEGHVSLCVDQGAAGVVAILRVMKRIYAPAPFQLRRPSRVVYGRCFDRALHRGFERRLTPGIEWGEKRGRHATAAFERDAWDIALSHCLERSADPGTTISNLLDFD